MQSKRELQRRFCEQLQNQMKDPSPGPAPAPALPAPPVAGTPDSKAAVVALAAAICASLCCPSTCVDSEPWCGKSARQTGHTNGRSFVCLRMCVLRLPCERPRMCQQHQSRFSTGRAHLLTEASAADVADERLFACVRARVRGLQIPSQSQYGE